MNQGKIDFFEQLREEKLTGKALMERLEKMPESQKIKKEYEEYLAVTEGVRAYEENRLKALLKAEMNSTEITKNSATITNLKTYRSRRRVYLSMMAIAATILLLIVPLYNHYIFNELVYSSYNTAEYAGVELGEIVEETKKENDEKRYFDAIRLKANGEWDQAKQLLQEITTPSLTIQAQYHLALIYIKHKEFGKAEEILTPVIASDHYLNKPAKELQQDLQRAKLFFLFK